VTKAYHKACAKCCKKKKICAMCVEKKEIVKSEAQLEAEVERKNELMLEQPMKERERRTLLRRMEKAKKSGQALEDFDAEEEESEEEDAEMGEEGGDDDMPVVADAQQRAFHMPGESSIFSGGGN
jgi:hypothetical protein